MAVKGLLEGGFGGRLGVWGPCTPKLPRAPQNGDPALGMYLILTPEIDLIVLEIRSCFVYFLLPELQRHLHI